jgi:uncharacterized protein YkwD
MTSSRRTARTVTTVVAAAALSGGLAVAVPTVASAAPQDCNYMGYNSAPDRLGLQLDPSEQWMADNINAYRVQNGRKPLVISEQLRRPTMWGALDSATRKDGKPVDHVDTRGMDPMARAKFCGNYTGTRIGENKYWGKGGANGNALGLGPAALAWWKQSPGHNANMLSPDYTTFGVGWAYLGVRAEQGGYWTVMFGNA